MGPLGKVKLMEIPFNNMNGNLFGTKSISKLFETIELMQGYIEPSETQTKYVALDQERIDLIKSEFINLYRILNALIVMKRLFSFDFF